MLIPEALEYYLGLNEDFDMLGMGDEGEEEDDEDDDEDEDDSKKDKKSKKGAAAGGDEADGEAKQECKN